MSLVVDIHSHLYPDWFVDLFRSRTGVPRVETDGEGERLLLFATPEGEESGPLLTDEYTTVGAKLAFMDRHRIDVSVVSLGNPWLEVLDGDEAVEVAREANRRLAALANETDGRIYGMGVLPPGRPDQVAATVEEVAARSGLRGVISSTTIGGRLFDDPALDPVWEALATHQVPLLVHPMLAHLPPDLVGYRIALSAGIGFPYQTTVALARLLLGGVLDRHPHLRLVAAHGGGALPYLMGRLEGTHAGDPTPLRAAARRLLFDAALYDPEAVSLAADLVGADRLLFGTDHPFPNADAERIGGAVRAALPAGEAAAVMGEAAVTWYRLQG